MLLTCNMTPASAGLLQWAVGPRYLGIVEMALASTLVQIIGLFPEKNEDLSEVLQTDRGLGSTSREISPKSSRQKTTLLS